MPRQGNFHPGTTSHKGKARVPVPKDQDQEGLGAKEDQVWGVLEDRKEDSVGGRTKGKMEVLEATRVPRTEATEDLEDLLVTETGTDLSSLMKRMLLF